MKRLFIISILFKLIKANIEIKSTETKEILTTSIISSKKDILNETLNNILGDVDSKKVMATADGLFHLLSVLKVAIRLSFQFFNSIFSFFYNSMSYFISPVLWIIQFGWSQCVKKPFDLLLYLINITYPVLMFCLAAAFCGIFIGGCAGFAAEAFSSILISATWGPQPLSIKSNLINDIINDEEDDNQDENQFISEIDKSTETDEDTDEPFNHNSRSSSISSFFMQPLNIKNSKGKNSNIKNQIIDHWNSTGTQTHNLSKPSTHLNNNPASSSSIISPVLIRRMKLSSTNIDQPSPKQNQRKNSWQWDEDEEDEHHGFIRQESLYHKLPKRK